MLVIDQDGLRSSHPLPEQKASMCLFEHVYFARPDSLIYGQSVNESRHKMGKRLAIEHPADADLVVPVPDSGVPAAIGYAQASGIPFGQGLVKNRYIGRTFIMPGQVMRRKSVRQKLNPIGMEFKDKVVLLVDDSIVRGTTSREIVSMAREAGVSEVAIFGAAKACANLSTQSFVRRLGHGLTVAWDPDVTRLAIDRGVTIQVDRRGLHCRRSIPRS